MNLLRKKLMNAELMNLLSNVSVDIVGTTILSFKRFFLQIRKQCFMCLSACYRITYFLLKNINMTFINLWYKCLKMSKLQSTNCMGNTEGNTNEIILKAYLNFYLANSFFPIPGGQMPTALGLHLDHLCALHWTWRPCLGGPLL